MFCYFFSCVGVESSLAKMKVSFIGILVLLLAMPSWVAADSYDQEMSLGRTTYKAAERAYKKGQMGHYQKLVATLKDYPLYPYLVHRDLVKRLHRLKDEDVQGFIDKWPDSPLAERLRRSWLGLQARRGHWKTYLKFDRPSKNVTRQCRTIWALYQTGNKTEALNRVKPLWLHHESQPKACDQVFRVWKSSGRLSSELIWARVRLAMNKGNWRMAKWLKKELNKRDRKWVEEWITAYKHPSKVLQQRALKKDHPIARMIILAAVKRQVRKDTQQASALWKKAEKRYAFTAKDRAEIARKMGVYLALDRDPEALQWFSHLSEFEEDESALGWAVRVSMVLGDWNGALAWIDRMPKKLAEDQRWRYWRGRILEELGKTHEANKYFAGVSLNRSFYGFLAADRVGAEYNFEQRALDNSESMRHYVETLPGVQRARELYVLGKELDARREWRVLDLKLDKPELQVAAKLAQEWGWHSRAIMTVARGKHFDDLELRFPLAFQKPIVKYAEDRELDPSWVFAVARQESAFAPDARSPVGATGLMQLMPRTARQVAKAMKTRLRRTSDLNKPELNIRYGTWYLRSVYNDLSNNAMLATAAYNAGPHRVKRWLPEDGGVMPADLWAELIPFKETRTYVRRVMAYAVIYDMRRGIKTPQRISQRMNDVYPKGERAPAIPPSSRVGTAALSVKNNS